MLLLLLLLGLLVLCQTRLLGAGYASHAGLCTLSLLACPGLLPVCLPGPGLPLLQLPTSLVLPPHFHDPGQRSWDRLGIDGLVEWPMAR